ncbi:glycoside hydrolase domain-containing protein [Heyndrickxia camelliae]|uniref:glycoside hydrolase domain-containing protein n=1 Tax=Heyndrickxia camelliae TaxID=1707093 RepID=UPI0013FD210A|nr:glycoside hydrolase domain-containing protein [Heyndrickxia camelliae]
MNNWKDLINWRLLIWVSSALLLFVIFPIIFHQNNHAPSNSEHNQETSKIVWGVDSASKVTDELFKCVDKYYGKPDIWARYTKTNKGASAGLTAEEMKLLHKNKVNILLIYNHFNNATTEKAGENEAKAAIQYAKELKAPKGTVLFADIEPKYPVDADFIKGWYKIMSKSDYHPGIYGVFDPDQKIYKAFNQAAKNNKSLKDETILWSAAPQKGITKKENAPKFNPSAPKNSRILGYQYGMEAKSCNIDTNLFKGEILSFSWE